MKLPISFTFETEFEKWHTIRAGMDSLYGVLAWVVCYRK